MIIDRRTNPNTMGTNLSYPGREEAKTLIVVSSPLKEGVGKDEALALTHYSPAMQRVTTWMLALTS